MTKQPTRLVFLCALLGFGMQAKAWSADDRVCTKHILAPGYPRLAWQAQVTGTVDVEVAADGSVRSAVGSGALNLLNHAAEENVRQWIFCSNAEGFKQKVAYVCRLEGRREDEQPPPTVVSFDLPDRVEVVSHPPAPHGY
jgi:hypothetical protein